MSESTLDSRLNSLAVASDSDGLNSALIELNVHLETLEDGAEGAAGILAHAGHHLFRIAQVESQLFVPPAMARLSDLLGRPFPEPEPFKVARREMMAQVDMRRVAGDQKFQLLMHLMLLESLIEGLDRALANFVSGLTSGPLPNWQSPLLTQIGKIVASNGWLSGRRPKTVKTLRRVAKVKRDIDGVRRILALIHGLGFIKTAPLDGLELIFSRLVLPGMDAAAKAGLYDIALHLERIAYLNYTQAVDNADQFRRTVSQWLPAMRQAGRRCSETLPALRKVVDGVAEDRPRVAFFLHGSAILGHTEVLLSFLRGLSKLEAPLIQAEIYIGDLPNDELTRRLSEYGIEPLYLRQMTPPGAGMADLLLVMRRDANTRGVECIVYTSLILNMSFAFSLRLAPVQIWWSMKYHSISFPEVDGYMALGSFDTYREIEARPWRAVHRSMEVLFAPELAEQAAAIRAELMQEADHLILGCIGREEKLVSPDYIRALSQILDAVPDALFIWTGQQENRNVTALLEDAGIASRCCYVGWVNTRLYAQVLDVFVDSFPFASGLTAFEAMAAGCPVVAKLTPEALGTGMPAHVWPVYAGEAGDDRVQNDVRALFTDSSGTGLLPFVDDDAAFCNVAIRLCLDKEYRLSVGDAQRTFVNRYMTNDELMAETGSQHILEIIREKRAGVH